MNPISNCDLTLCIFNHQNRCSLDKIGINGDGCCDSIIYPNISDEDLKRYKKETADGFKQASLRDR